MNGDFIDALKVYSILCWIFLLSFIIGAFIEGYILIGILLLSIPLGYIFYFLFFKEKIQQKKLMKKMEERKMKMKQMYEQADKKMEEGKVKMKQIYDQGLAQLRKQKYKEARSSFKRIQDDSIGIRLEFIQDIEMNLELAENGLNLEKIKNIDSIIKDGDKNQTIFNEKIDFSNLYNQFEKKSEKKAVWRGQETKAFKIWHETRKKSNEYDYEYPLLDYEYALKFTHDLYDSKDKDQVQNKILKKINDTAVAEINIIRENSKQLRKRKKFGGAIEKLNLALDLIDKITNLELKNKLVNEINLDLDQTYIQEIDLLKTEAEKALNFNKSIKIYNQAQKIAQKINTPHDRKNKIRMIDGLIKNIKTAKIKSTILHLGTKFARLQIIEIAEECGEDEDLIITTVREMIEGKEIYARYFDSSRAVAFNLQANIDEIDSLMDKYKQWEKDEKDKI